MLSILSRTFLPRPFIPRARYNEQDVLLSVQPDVEEGSEVSAGGGVEGGVLDNTGQTGKEVKSKPEQRDRQQCLICIVCSFNYNDKV